MNKDPLEKFAFSPAFQKKVDLAFQVIPFLAIWIIWGVIVWADPKDWKVVTLIAIAVSAYRAFALWAWLKDDGLTPRERSKTNEPNPERSVSPGGAEKGARLDS
jgi:hypothetical protein